MSKKKTVTKNEPWAPAQPYILEGMEQTQRVFDENQPQLDKYAKQSFDTYGRTAPGAERGIMASQRLANDTIGGKYLNGNPYIDSIINKNAGDIRDNVGLAYSGSGRYGSGMMGDTLADNIGEMATNLRYGNYADERQNQIGAVGQAQDLMRGSQAQLEQAATLPWIGVAAQNGNIRQASNGYGTTTTKQSGGVLDAAMGLGGLGLKAYSTFSDERVKDIHGKVGETPEGLGIYEYAYKPELDPTQTPQVGVLAQEVEKVRPDAVGNAGGIKTVDYAALGLPDPANAARDLQQNVTVPKRPTAGDWLFNPDTSTTRGKLGVLGEHLMAGSSLTAPIGQGLLGMRREGVEQGERDEEKQHRRKVEERLAQASGLDAEYKQAQIAKMNEPDVPQESEIVRRLRAAGVDPASPEGRAAILRSVQGYQYSDEGIDAAGRRAAVTRAPQRAPKPYVPSRTVNGQKFFNVNGEWYDNPEGR